MNNPDNCCLWPLVSKESAGTLKYGRAGRASRPTLSKQQQLQSQQRGLRAMEGMGWGERKGQQRQLCSTRVWRGAEIHYDLVFMLLRHVQEYAWSIRCKSWCVAKSAARRSRSLHQSTLCLGVCLDQFCRFCASDCLARIKRAGLTLSCPLT